MKTIRNGLILGIITLLVLSSLACSLGGRGKSPARTVARTTRAARVPAVTLTPTTWPPTYTPTAMPEPPTTTLTPSAAPATSSPTATYTPSAVPATSSPTITPTPVPPPPQGQNPLDKIPIPELQVRSLDPHGGMFNLNTFRQKLAVHFKATDSDLFANYYYDADVNLQDEALHAVVKVEGKATAQLPANKGEAIWIGDRLWIKLGNQPWMPVPESVAEMQFEEQMFGVGAFLPYVPKVQRQGEETVNGIPSAHYTYRADNLSTQYGTINGGGDIYVALQGGYVVRFTLNGSGNFTEFYDGSGNINLAYDTYDVGAEINISPPQAISPRR